MPDEFDVNSISASEKSQDANRVSIQPQSLAAGLYLVATPIGNLRDITLRALDVLASADIVLAEDTRTSRKLFNAYGIKTPLSAYHDHNAAKRAPNLCERIENGKAIALISDAGTPMVSDPGYKLARGCIDAGLAVTTVPGASAVLSGLILSGLPSDKFMFAGFLPAKTSARKTVLQGLKTVPASLVFYESAGRLSAMLTDAFGVLGNRRAAIARELTKKYEEVLRGSLSDLVHQLDGIKLRGEIVVILSPPQSTDTWNDTQITQALKSRIGDIGVKRASAEISDMSGRKKRDVYTLALKLKDEI